MRPLNDEELELIKETRAKAPCAHLADLLEDALQNERQIVHEETVCILMCPECLYLLGNGKLSKLLDSTMDDGTRKSFHAFINGFWLSIQLKDKKVVRTELTKDSLTISFDNGHRLVVALRSEPGADSNWYNWTEVILHTGSGSVTLINE